MGGIWGYGLFLVLKTLKQRKSTLMSNLVPSVETVAIFIIF